MSKAIEETLKKCKKCKKETVHRRNINKTGLAMFLVHATLTVITAGIWLILLLIWVILNAKIGGWSCSECGK